MKWQTTRILTAVPHNSGTTLLTHLLANIIKPDVPYFHAADGYSGTDHVASRYKIQKACSKNLSFVAPLHIRSSPGLTDICTQASIKTIVMTRNIYDTIVSLRDRVKKHKDKRRDESSLVFTQTLPIHSKLSDEQIELFLIKYAVPWYFSFVASWIKSGQATHFLRYEDLLNKKEEALSTIFIKLGIDIPQNKITDGINETKRSDTRLNVGITGRGEALKHCYRREIGELANLYPGVNFSILLD